MISNKKAPFTIGIMMAITFIGKLMGILRDRMQAVYFGTDTACAIAFMQASMLPRVFMDIMFASLFSASFIPVFNRYIEEKGKQAAFRLAAVFVFIISGFLLLITLILIFLAEPIYLFFFGGELLSYQVKALGIALLRIMLPIILISGVAFSLTGILQSLGQFNIPAAMSVASNGIILLYYFFFIDYFGIYGLAVVFLIGWGFQIIIQVPFLIKHKIFSFGKSGFKLGECISGLKEIGKLSLPVMVASWLIPVNLLVNNRASVDLYGGRHGVVSLNYAYTLYTVITGLFVLSIVNYLFPALSKLAAGNDWNEYVGHLRDSLSGMLFILIPMAFGLMALSLPLVRLVFLGGLFRETSATITASALFYFSFGMIGFGIHAVLMRASFALLDGKGPMIAGLAAIVTNFILSFALAPGMEIGGPALASSISISVAAIGLFIRLNKKLPIKILTPAFMRNIAKLVAISLFMFVASRFCISLLDSLISYESLFTRLVMVCVPALFGALIYLTAARLFNIKEAKYVFGLVAGLGR